MRSPLKLSNMSLMQNLIARLVQLGAFILLGKWVKSHKKGIEKKMGQILSRLKSLAKRRDELDLKNGIQNEMKQSPNMPTSPSVDDSEVFRRDDDK